ncbi:sugar phosphate isomerase/epimerase family protein [Leadbettera azotonutricia]|uniref:Sugar phosphate isomerase/epimerase n=1 Tax=Leadbettera azotonutricia (strain ATCC BAA-888 / DSM 13862 / ZAS-9) TaxID=545695 RepID=F5Y6Y4_LEAAZ|nr:sugar phosphate isomerase/epimerase [Leadbettera azotonutricia]AEF82875.1 sugar phosphate isomerase/epimerase [Leadbettera azotonutricia ZAS-9]
MFPIMLQLYNVRDEMAKDFDGTLKQVAGAGYKYVELALAQSYGKTAAQFKDSLGKAGLTAISAHVPFRDMTKDPEKVIGFHVDIGCKFIAIPFLGEEDRSGSPAYGEVKKEIARLGEIVNKKGAVLLYHNHEFEFVDYQGKYMLDDLYDSIPASLLQTEIDVCWAKVGGVVPAEYILKYSGRAPVVHLKDFDSSQGGKIKADYDLIGEAKKARQAGAFPFRAVGHGVQDIPAILKASEKAGAKWVVVEQDLPSPGMTPIECAKQSLDYLKGLK